MSQFDQKLVAIVNKSLESGKAMNALAHMSIALGAKLDQDKVHLVDYFDADEHRYPTISKMPYIILRANSNKIKNLDAVATEQNIAHVTFTEAMTVGTWQEQLDKSKQTKRDDLIFYGIVLYGDYADIENLTKKFSLWR